MALRLDEILNNFKKLDKTTTTSKIVPILISKLDVQGKDQTLSILTSTQINSDSSQFETFSTLFLKTASSLRFKFEFEIQVLVIIVLGLLAVFLSVSIFFKIFCLSHFCPKKTIKISQVLLISEKFYLSTT